MVESTPETNRRIKLESRNKELIKILEELSREPLEERLRGGLAGVISGLKKIGAKG